MEPAKQPARLCVGCREQHPKDALIRVVRSPAGAVFVDPAGKSPGRGAYVCPRRECLQAARKTGALARAFKGRVDPAVYDALADAVRAQAED